MLLQRSTRRIRLSTRACFSSLEELKHGLTVDLITRPLGGELITKATSSFIWVEGCSTNTMRLFELEDDRLLQPLWLFEVGAAQLAYLLEVPFLYSPPEKILESRRLLLRHLTPIHPPPFKELVRSKPLSQCSKAIVLQGFRVELRQQQLDWLPPLQVAQMNQRPRDL